MDTMMATVDIEAHVHEDNGKFFPGVRLSINGELQKELAFGLGDYTYDEARAIANARAQAAVERCQRDHAQED